MTRVIACVFGTVVACLPHLAPAQDLILRDIGVYSWNEWQDHAAGTSGLAGTGRLISPHDERFRTSYRDRTRDVGVRVTVSKHSLPARVAHELELGYRSREHVGFSEGVRLSGEGPHRRIELIIAESFDPGGHISWRSGAATIVDVEFTFRGRDRVPEIPSEVIDAYLALYPSTLPDTIEDSPEHHTQWERDEMRRILEYAARDLALARSVGDERTRAYRRDRVEEWLRDFTRTREALWGSGSGEQFRFELGMAQVQTTKPGDPSTLDVPRFLTWLERRLEELTSWWAAHENDPMLLRTPGAEPLPTNTIRLPPTRAVPPTPQ